jgi:hypothetical protein
MKNLVDKKAVKRYIKLMELNVNSFNRILEFTEHRLLMNDIEKHSEIITEADEYIVTRAKCQEWVFRCCIGLFDNNSTVLDVW